MDSRKSTASCARAPGSTTRCPAARCSRRWALGAAGLAGLAASLPGVAQAQTPKRGGTIKIGSFQNIDTLDAHNTTFITACAIHNNIYNGLLKITSTDGKSVDFKPELAREWEVQGDRVHVFRLHKGVTFHNGDPCTSADIKWNLERVKDKTQAPIHAWKLELLEAIETPDPHTIKLTFAKPYPFLRVAFTGSTGRAATILSPRAVKEKGKAYGRSPVGTGPFKFVEWKEGDFILLERFADYWEKDAAGGKLPYVDKVLIKFIVEPSTLVAALKTGEVDGVNAVSPQFMAELRKDPKLNAMSAVGGNWRCMHMNMAKEPFSDKNLRKAVTFAIDRKEILERVEFGEGIIAHGPISPPMGAFYDAAYETGQERAVLRPRAGQGAHEAVQVRQRGGGDAALQQLRHRTLDRPRWSRPSSPRSASRSISSWPTPPRSDAGGSRSGSGIWCRSSGTPTSTPTRRCTRSCTPPRPGTRASG